ncbi:unnamed protein product [Alopecurus aequalis]
MKELDEEDLDDGETMKKATSLALGAGRENTGAKLPPGPWNLPIIGSLHHLVIGTKLPPHRALLRLSRRHGPVMLLRLGEVPKVIVSTPEAAMEVLKTNDLAFATRPSGPTMDIVSSSGRGLVFAPYGEHWRQMRKVCVVEVLSARQVRRIESIKQAEEAYLRELAAMAALVGGFSLVDLFPSSRLVRWLSSAAGAVRRSHARVQSILGGIIRERQENKPNAASAARDDEDLLDVLLRLHKEDDLSIPLTPDIISAVIFDIFGAATDTTAATIEWAMAELIRSPHAMVRAKLEVRQKLGVHHQKTAITSADVHDLHYLRMVVRETLRLHPPGPMIHRASREDCQVMGYTIPKGTAVTINAFAVGMDPSHWGQDAAEFRPERFEEMSTEYGWQGPKMEFIPFGAGRRQCPGALLATTTIELVLANLLYYFDWAVPGGAAPETLDMGEVFGIIVRTRSSLCLQAVAARHLQDH